MKTWKKILLSSIGGGRWNIQRNNKIETNKVLIKEGKGHKAYKNSRLFEGDFKDGKREGKGICKLTNGSVYESEFKNDLFKGKVTYK